MMTKETDKGKASRLGLKRYADGRLRPYWYGDFIKDGKRRVVTLCRIKGTPPPSLAVADAGDPAYEHSRAKALEMLNEYVENRRAESDQVASIERIHSFKYGTKSKSTKLADLVAAWDQLPRRRKPSALHRANSHRILSRFTGYMAANWPAVKDLAGVTAEQVRGFMDAEGERKIADATRPVSARTWNMSLMTLRGMFNHLEPYADGYRRYLSRTPTREEEIIHRQPYSPEQMHEILEAGKGDALLHPLIVTAYCTGMRRGDCCTLRWSNVDLDAGFITVKTSKTRETVEFPILPLLRDTLIALRPTGPVDPEAYVFPEAARLYRAGPDALDRRLKTVLAQAGFAEPPRRDPTKSEQPRLPQVSAGELRRRGLEAIAQSQMTTQARARALEIFKRYMDGQSVKTIAAGMKSSVGIVSRRLNDVQRMTGVAVIRHPEPTPPIQGNILAPLDALAAPRLRRGSLRGWHSFRTTFVTYTLAAGVPMELVRRVTGHKTADVVLKHYFRPDRAQFRKALQDAMPKMLTAGTKSENEQLRDIITRMKPPSLRRQALAILDGKM
jgi:integrase